MGVPGASGRGDGATAPLARLLDARWPPAALHEILRAGPEAAARAPPAAAAGALGLALTGVDPEGVPALLAAARTGGVEAAPGPSGTGSGWLFTGSDSSLAALADRLRDAPGALEGAGRAIERALAARGRAGPRTVPTAHGRLVVGTGTLVMGVVNVTPDSFSDGGRFLDAGAAVHRAETLAADGADLIDIGGESTRPGAHQVDVETEWRRVGPVIEGVAGTLGLPISIDTRHSEVARRAIAAGADLVNDVSGLADSAMRRVVAATGAAAVVMPRRGTPATMAALTEYGDLRGEVAAALDAATRTAIAEGVEPDRLIVDPGLGFAKTPAQSLELLAHVGELRSLGFPVLVGASRKSFLGWVLGGVDVGARETASVAAAVFAARAGAEIVRVHDVAATVRGLAGVATAPPRAGDRGRR